MVEAIRHVAGSGPSVDRGHRHSDGRAVTAICAVLPPWCRPPLAMRVEELGLVVGKVAAETNAGAAIAVGRPLRLEVLDL